jgi:Ca-activated chloride channel homolog
MMANERKYFAQATVMSSMQKAVEPARKTCGTIGVNEVSMARHSGFCSRPKRNRDLSSELACIPCGLFPARVSGAPLLFFVFVMMLALAGYWLPAAAQAQTATETDPINEVHVTPRVPISEAAKKEIINPALETHTKPIKVDADLVLVPVTITDPMNRLVTGLDKDNFAVYEDKSQQEIRHFSSEDAPVSIGIIFDMSGSMGSKIERAREAVVQFLKTANPQDEFFMITFADKPEEVSGFTQNVDDIQNKLLFTVPKGRTALLDAIYLGITEMRQAKYPKRALLIISDGGDNHSRYTEGEIKSMVREADTLIYAIGIYDHYFPTPEEQLGPELLSEITEVTGGRAFTIDNPNDLADVATKIGIELRNQYVLGYRPKNEAHDGKWRKIRVKLIPPKGLPPLRVFAKSGYYAPSP